MSSTEQFQYKFRIPTYITLHHITSHHITSHHITSHHITIHHITSHYIILSTDLQVQIKVLSVIILQ